MRQVETEQIFFCALTLLLMPSIPHDFGTYIIAALGPGGDFGVELVKEAAAAGVEQSTGGARVDVGRGDSNKPGHCHDGGEDAHFVGGMQGYSAGDWRWVMEGHKDDNYVCVEAICMNRYKTSE